MAALAVAIAGFIAMPAPELQTYSIIAILLAMAVAFFCTAAGNMLNDYFDLETDRINRPGRPLPAGELQPSTVAICAIIIFGCTLWLAWTINFLALLITLIAILLMMGYELRLKSKGFLGNLTISALVALLFVFGAVAVQNAGSISTIITATVPPWAILALLAFFATLGRELVKDIEDIKGDLARTTVPRQYGIKPATIVAATALSCAIALSPLPYYPLQIFNITYVYIILIADCLFVYSIYIMHKNPSQASKISKVAMLTALVAFIVGQVAAVTS